MQRLVIHLTNALLFVVVVVGIPAITSARLGSLGISAAATAERLMLWGSALAAIGNAAAALSLLKGRREKLLCWKWTGVFAGLLTIQFLSIHRYIHFDWLRSALRWMEGHL